MYTNISTADTFPKTLVIRVQKGGLIWQRYHVQAEREAERLSKIATRNGFEYITLEDYQPEQQETWPDWEETEGGKAIINDEQY